MLETTADLDYDAVGGLTLGADPVADAMLHAAAAQGRTLDAFVVRKSEKQHGLQRRIEGPDVAGRRVLAVEDTSTTGGSVLTAVEALREAGAEVVGVAVDRRARCRARRSRRPACPTSTAYSPRRPRALSRAAVSATRSRSGDRAAGLTSGPARCRCISGDPRLVSVLVACWRSRPSRGGPRMAARAARPRGAGRLRARQGLGLPCARPDAAVDRWPGDPVRKGGTSRAVTTVIAWRASADGRFTAFEYLHDKVTHRLARAGSARGPSGSPSCVAGDARLPAQ